MMSFDMKMEIKEQRNRKRKRGSSICSKKKKRMQLSTSLVTTTEECCFCHSGEDFRYGTFFKNVEMNIAAHQFCLLFSAGLPQRGEDDEGFDGFLLKDIYKEAQRTSVLECKFCHKFGANSGCCKPSCRIFYHYECGLQHGIQFVFTDSFNSFCPLHRSFQDLSWLKHPKNESVCAICLDVVTPANASIETVLKTPCCKNVYMHRSCVQRQASISGYFFRCPICNNKEKFTLEMSKYGIYIPSRDAAWEESNAYSDLLQQYDKCDLQKCKSTKGRKYNTKSGRWHLIRCYLCGQSAVHVKCLGNHYIPGFGYVCIDCNSVVRMSSSSANVILQPSMQDRWIEHKRRLLELTARDDPVLLASSVFGKKIWCKKFNIRPCKVYVSKLELPVDVTSVTPVTKLVQDVKPPCHARSILKKEFSDTCTKKQLLDASEPHSNDLMLKNEIEEVNNKNPQLHSPFLQEAVSKNANKANKARFIDTDGFCVNDITDADLETMDDAIFESLGWRQLKLMYQKYKYNKQNFGSGIDDDMILQCKRLDDYHQTLTMVNYSQKHITAADLASPDYFSEESSPGPSSATMEPVKDDDVVAVLPISSSINNNSSNLSGALSGVSNFNEKRSLIDSSTTTLNNVKSNVKEEKTDTPSLKNTVFNFSSQKDDAPCSKLNLQKLPRKRHYSVKPKSSSTELRRNPIRKTRKLVSKQNFKIQNFEVFDFSSIFPLLQNSFNNEQQMKTKVTTKPQRNPNKSRTRTLLTKQKVQMLHSNDDSSDSSFEDDRNLYELQKSIKMKQTKKIVTAVTEAAKNKLHKSTPTVKQTSVLNNLKPNEILKDTDSCSCNSKENPKNSRVTTEKNAMLTRIIGRETTKNEIADNKCNFKPKPTVTSLEEGIITNIKFNQIPPPATQTKTSKSGTILPSRSITLRSDAKLFSCTPSSTSSIVTPSISMANCDINEQLPIKSKSTTFNSLPINLFLPKSNSTTTINSINKSLPLTFQPNTTTPSSKKSAPITKPATSTKVKRDSAPITKSAASTKVKRDSVPITKPAASIKVKRDSAPITKSAASTKVKRDSVPITKPAASIKVKRDSAPITKSATSTRVKRDSVPITKSATSTKVKEDSVPITKPASSTRVKRDSVPITKSATSTQIKRDSVPITKSATSTKVKEDSAPITKPVTSTQVKRDSAPITKSATSTQIKRDSVPITKPATSTQVKRDSAPITKSAASTQVKEDSAAITKPATSTKVKRDSALITKPATSTQVKRDSVPITKPASSTQVKRDSVPITKPATPTKVKVDCAPITKPAASTQVKRDYVPITKPATSTKINEVPTKLIGICKGTVKSSIQKSSFHSNKESSFEENYDADDDDDDDDDGDLTYEDFLPVKKGRVVCRNFPNSHLAHRYHIRPQEWASAKLEQKIYDNTQINILKC